MLDLSGPTATLANWYTPFFESECAPVFNTFMRDLDIDATGQFAVISTTGAYRGGIEAWKQAGLPTAAPGQKGGN